MPFFACCIIGCCASFLIWFRSKKFYDRLKFFEDFKNFLDNLNINFSFLQDELPKVIENYNNLTQFGILISSFKNYLQNMNVDSFLIEIKAIPNLKNEEQEKISDFFCQLGRSDVNTQKTLISSTKSYVENVVNCCREEVNKKATLIQKLGVVVGLVVVIMLL